MRQATLINHIPALSGLIKVSKLFGQITVFGLVGGAAFWAVITVGAAPIGRST